MEYKQLLRLKVTPAADQAPAFLHAAELQRKAYNIAVDDWICRHRGRAKETAKQRKPGAKGKEPVESTKLYRYVVDLVPELSAINVSAACQMVTSNLSAKMDWRKQDGEKGKQLKRQDAVLAYDDRPPYLTALQMQMHYSQVRLTVGDDITAVIKPLRNAPLQFTVSGRRLPARYRKWLAEMASGKRKLPCSYLAWNDNKSQWYWYVSVSLESSDADPSRQAVLTPNHDANDRPFRLLFDDSRPWGVGDGRYLKAQTARLVGLRKQIGWRYRNGNGAGHGRKKIDAAVRKRRLQQRNVNDEFRRRMINDIARQCKRRQCGVLVYRKPSNPVKEVLWFAEAGVEFDWTRFETDLKNVLARHGIAVKRDKYLMADWKQEMKEDAAKTV